MNSGRLYSLVTKYWPRIAAGLVVGIAVLDLVLGTLTADSSLELYLLAWATSTAGLWYLAEKGEAALSDESHTKVAGWIREVDLGSTIWRIPEQFAHLFDRLFGDRHLSWGCFWRSAVASFASVTIVLMVAYPVWIERQYDLGPSVLQFVVVVVLGGGLFNVFPDYLSLLETRWVLQRMSQSPRSTPALLALDLILTTAISSGSIVVGYAAIIVGLEVADYGSGALMSPSVLASAVVAGLSTLPTAVTVSDFTAVYFYSAFFTSIWLWLYSASMLVSRVLLKMNDGVGFLLRVTDVENQPFRSMGFVSVLIVSGLFLLGLPLVLL